MSALVTALIQLDGSDRDTLERNVYYQRLEIPKWLRATVDVLRGPHADVTPIIDAETAARAEARRREEEKERRAKRAKPPSAQDLETANITTWDDMEALLKAVTTKTAANVTVSCAARRRARQWTSRAALAIAERRPGRGRR